MKNLLIFILSIFTISVFAQRDLKATVVFSSEPQNRMISKVPELLLDAFKNGDVPAYYPKSVNTPIPYHQFLSHFEGDEQAARAMQAGPAWFCERKVPGLSQQQRSCFSNKFILLKRNTTQKAKEHVYIQLVQTADCVGGGYDRMGPIFKVGDVARLDNKSYPLVNPRNEAMVYSINDALLLNLYADRERLKD